MNKKINIALTKKRKCKYFLAAFCVFLAIACYNGLSVKVYRTQSDKIIKESEIRIILLSDLHNTVYGKEQKNLLKKITDQNPDLILITGDMYDNKSLEASDGTRKLLSKVTDIAPAFYVMGNHEYWIGGTEEITEELHSFGITVLSDDYRQLKINDNTVIVAGTEDSGEKPAMKKAFENLDSDGDLKILMSHYPENIESYASYPFDLVLSGHAHGGQVRIPFILNGLYAPGQGIFPEYAGGLYEYSDDLTLVVSRGLSRKFSAIVRVFNRPELVVIIIENK